jgi:hypothetical protein
MMRWKMRFQRASLNSLERDRGVWCMGWAPRTPRPPALGLTRFPYKRGGVSAPVTLWVHGGDDRCLDPPAR